MGIADVSRAPAQIILTTSDLRKWEAEDARLSKEIEVLTEQQQRVRAKINAARELMDGVEPVLAKPKVRSKAKRIVISKPKEPAPIVTAERHRRVSAKPTWMSEISKAIRGAASGLSYPELKAAIDLGPLGPRLRESDKGLYGGVAKLEAAGELAKYNGRLFSPKSLKEFRRAVAAGEVKDIPPPSLQPRPSPMGDAIMKFIDDHPFGVASGEIVNDLKGYPEFVGTVTRNKTAAYNVIKRLLERGQIGKEGNLYVPSNENEPPHGDAEGGSESGQRANAD